MSSRTYTPRHQIATVGLDQTIVSQTVYDNGRRLTDRSLGNGLNSIAWRTDNLADTITVTNPTTNAVIIDFTYAYDANKRKTSEVDQAPGMASYSQTFGYDDEDRLTAWARPGQPGVAQTWRLSLGVGDWQDTTANGVLIDHAAIIRCMN